MANEVEKVVNLFKVIKYCFQYENLQNNTQQEAFDEAWEMLDVEVQRKLINIVENNIQPSAKGVAEEMLLCKSKEELTLLKAEFGEYLSKQAWMLLSDEQKIKILAMCSTPTPNPTHPPVEEDIDEEPEVEREPEPEMEPQPSEVKREITVELDLNISPKPTELPESKPKSLIELSEEEENLKEIIEGILEDTEGRIPPELADAFDELLSRQTENDKQLKTKLDNYCAVIKYHRDWSEIRSKEAERLKNLAERDLSLAKVLEARLKNYLETSGKMKIKTKRFHPRIINNGGKTPVNLNVPAEDLPPKYKIEKVLINPDLDALREALAAGEELSYASLGKRGTHLRFT